jgi:hypothetical protein
VVVVVGVELEGCEFDFDDAVAAAELSLAEMVTPTPSNPFIPAPAWPGTAQRYSYFPLFVNMTVRVADCPCFRIAVAFPTQAFFAAVEVGVVQILKLWSARPEFVTLNVIAPG